jgi:hypothetical protein
MKKRDEQLADSRLEKMGIAPSIYHFDVPVYPFRAITIADTQWGWDVVRKMIEGIVTGPVSKVIHERSTLMMQELHDRGIYGVAICDARDQLNRQRGRTIAKGRLWKHLKRGQKENE